MTLSNESSSYVPTHVLNCRGCLLARNAATDLAVESGALDTNLIRRAAAKARCEAHR